MFEVHFSHCERMVLQTMTMFIVVVSRRIHPFLIIWVFYHRETHTDICFLRIYRCALFTHVRVALEVSAHRQLTLYLKSFSGIPAHPKNIVHKLFSSTYGALSHIRPLSAVRFSFICFAIGTICFALATHTSTSRAASASEEKRKDRKRASEKNTKTNPLRTVEYDPVMCMARTLQSALVHHRHGNSAFRDVTPLFSNIENSNIFFHALTLWWIWTVM